MYFSLSFNRERYTRVLKGCFDENLDKVAISYLVLQNSLKLIKILKLGARNTSGLTGSILKL